MSTLDFRGEECPGPLVKTLRALAKIGKGEKIVVLTTSQQCVELLKQVEESLEIAKMEVHRKESFYEIIIEKTRDGVEENNLHIVV